MYAGGALAAGASLIHTTKNQNRYPAEKGLDPHQAAINRSKTVLL